ncbi:hypothetical protein [Streptomyces poriferorum]|uniref:Uncharacterized protein n=1 Tax=Streptomyces poriferorum TaxID=2798799 RepID=A0ABY9IVR6_9ACTN|nr:MULTISPECIES: hypothetical protein [unclassified Streptomyces]MDP5312066.1 hypothetical protein [Streptomyces sp. Alt4]WLQ58879.1 hypothetical protein P8A19_27140 [Streptomyces sp. Alt2]
MPAPVPPTHPEPAAQPATDVVRWAVFGCLLVPAVLLAHGDSAGGAAAVALGLAAITVACRVLLRRSARTAAREGSGPAHRPTEGAHRSERTARVVRR